MQMLEQERYKKKNESHTQAQLPVPSNQCFFDHSAIFVALLLGICILHEISSSSLVFQPPQSSLSSSKAYYSFGAFPHVNLPCQENLSPMHCYPYLIKSCSPFRSQQKCYFPQKAFLNDLRQDCISLSQPMAPSNFPSQ